MVGWTLTAIAVLGLVGIGLAALAAPRRAAVEYGIVLDDPRALAFLRAMGARDLVIGALLALVAATASRDVLAVALWLAVPIAVVDLLVVLADARVRAVAPGARPAWLAHAAGVVGLLLAGVAVRAGF